MRTLTTVLFLASACNMTAQPRLLLIPMETAVAPQANVTFDVVAINDSKESVNIRSLESFRGVYSIRDTTGKRQHRVSGFARTATHSSKERKLLPGAFEQQKIRLDVPAEPGDVVQVYIKIGSDPGMRSNSLLLYCPAEPRGENTGTR